MSIRVTQVKSKNGANRSQLATLRTLGLRRIGQSVEREDSPELRGMLYAVQHLVKIDD